MPLEISKLALQLDDNNVYGNSMITAIRDLYNKYGLRIFTTGYLATQYKHAAWTGLYFATLPLFDRLIRSTLKTTRSNEYNPGEERCRGSLARDNVTDGLVSMVSGFLAGVAGALANRPGDTVRTIIQKRCMSSPDFVGDGGFRGAYKVYMHIYISFL